jgi:RNA polymerase sigma factor (sigma-70 family)
MRRQDRQDELTAFFREEYPRLVGTLSLYCGSRPLAEELGQEALARACRDWSKVRQMDHPSAWLYRVAMNLARSSFRRRRAERRANERSFHLEPAVNIPDVGTALEVRAAVATLPRRQREAFVYRKYLGLTVGETAREMDCSEGTVRALTSQAKKSLARTLALEHEREVRSDARLG